MPAEMTVDASARGTPVQDKPNSGRITPTAALNAYKATGIKPDPEQLIECHAATILSGSPAVAIAAAAGYHSTTILANARGDGGWLAERLGVTGPYLEGFHAGFWGWLPSGTWAETLEYRAGWKDGSAVFAAVRSRIEPRTFEVGR